MDPQEILRMNTRRYLLRYKPDYKGQFIHSLSVPDEDTAKVYADQLIYCTRVDKFITNPHQDGANLRRYFEHLNMLTFASFSEEQGGNLRRIIDVGASNRLIKEPAINNIIGLKPHMSGGDYLREAKYTTDNGLVLPDNCSLQTFQQFESQEHDLYNFTDSLYYIRDFELYDAVADKPFGVVACGTAHIPKENTDGLLRLGNNVFGEVRRYNASMTMKVKGNPESYNHPIILTDALKYDTFVYYAPDDSVIYNDDDDQDDQPLLICHVMDRFDFGATVYIRFCIIKMHVGEFTGPSTTLWTYEQPGSHDAWVPEEAMKNVKASICVDSKNLCEITAEEEEFTKDTLLTKTDKEIVCYKKINAQIYAVKVKNLVAARENIVDTIANFKQDLRDKYANILIGRATPDFVMPTDDYNRIVKDLMQCDTIDLKALHNTLRLAMTRVPHADARTYLIPIVASALKEAFAVETTLVSVLQNTESQLYAKLKRGEDIRSKDTLFRRFARWLLNPLDKDF